MKVGLEEEQQRVPYGYNSQGVWKVMRSQRKVGKKKHQVFFSIKNSSLISYCSSISIKAK